MEHKPSLVGGACIIAGVCVGAGMLGLPSAGAGAWTLWSMFAVTLTMVVMTVSGWMLLESYKGYPLRVSFDTVTRDLLGKRVNALNNLSVYFVGGILLYAYITSSGLIIQEMLGLESHWGSVLFTLFFSIVVWHSTRAVDRISVLLVILMGLSFAFGISGMSMNVRLDLLLDRIGSETHYAPYALGMLPVALTSFGYHHSVSSMRAYYGEERRASRAILGGTAIALTFYLIWLASVFGNLPRSEFGPVIEQGGNVDALLKALGSVIESKAVASALNAFSMAAILSSFIGVGLGVFDYLADLFQFDNSRGGRAKSWAVTFLPPLLLSLLFPFGFLVAIGYAGAVATLWTCIIPPLLAWKVRRMGNQEGFRAPGGLPMIVLVIAFGVLTAAFHLLNMVDLLPVYKG
ncbi:aromatic amino acid transporter [Aeromonas simiae]|uniref:aromatic amino acid transporter n=1 Tax=Aeromonas simiae TaxID=218936 RepID=UPI00266DB142|nr:aromatic amino acid transporter [Aeromonas simiae]MDO2949951.1 aromatic amino acid transporter [Aeromonas simiae]MDO2953699.1 aromatic amino acid transporter [Aeromonas simiae]MDO2957308.1 aromatic amino acid transporter [Aeromonas simiae]